MINWLKKIFGISSVDFSALVANGAQIVDVRSKEEFRQGHVKGAINIALPVLQSTLRKLDKSKPVITCCASGVRSAQARTILQGNGFKEVYNGGGWRSLYQKLKV
jgi:rhodanese-related sulfurtransferase